MERQVRWVDDIREALRRLGGKAHLTLINKEVEKIRKGPGRPPLNETWENTVRQTLEDHCAGAEFIRTLRKSSNDDVARLRKCYISDDYEPQYWNVPMAEKLDAMVALGKATRHLSMVKVQAWLYNACANDKTPGSALQ